MSSLQFHRSDRNWVCQIKVMATFSKIAKFCPILEIELVKNATHPIFDIWLKLAHTILWLVLFRIKLVTHNLDSLWRRYDYFTCNIGLILVIGLVKNNIFHSFYLRKYNDLEAKIHTKITMLCLINILLVLIFEVAPKNIYSKNSKMTCLRKHNPKMNALIPNVMIQMLKIS